MYPPKWHCTIPNKRLAVPIWRFSLVEKTEQAARQQRGHFPLCGSLVIKGALTRSKGKGRASYRLHHSCPYQSLDKRAFTLQLGEQAKQDYQRPKTNATVEKKQLVLTSENRFIKMAVNQCKRQLVEFEAKLRLSNQAPEAHAIGFLFE